jgi:hypothetical protein
MYLYIGAYADETPVLDFRTQPYNSSNQGVKLSGNYVHIKGLTIQGAGDNGMQVTGSNNIVEFCTFRWNCDSGLQMKTGSNNLILNCDSYENFDYMTGGTSSPDYGGNADGFADKQYTNTGVNTYRGCRSWLNSDDGWDLYEKIGNTVIENSWCYANGPANYDMTDNIRYKTDSAAWFSKFKNSSGRYVIKNYGNGNGFKLGGNYTASNTTLRNCVAVKNTVKGFDQNNNNGTMTIYNCTGYTNSPDYGFSNSSYGTLIIKNCASLSSRSTNRLSSKSVTQSNNSWNSGFSCVASDFISLDDTQMINLRKANGSLPDITLLHQTASSGMIDKGVDLGMPFAGVAPDLGAFEYGLFTSRTEIEMNSDISINYSQQMNKIFIKGEIQNVDIYNSLGKKVFSSNSQTDYFELATYQWAKGVYMVVVKSKHKNSYPFKLLIR